MTPADFRSQLNTLVNDARDTLAFGEVIGPLLNMVASATANAAFSNGLCETCLLDQTHDMLDEMYPAYVEAYAPKDPLHVH